MSSSHDAPQFPFCETCSKVNTPSIVSLPHTIRASTDSSLSLASSNVSSAPIVENSMTLTVGVGPSIIAIDGFKNVGVQEVAWQSSDYSPATLAHRSKN